MNPSPIQSASFPYERCFLWLLLGSLLAVATPYFPRGESSTHDGGIRTFVWREQGPEPTTEPIYVDGRTMARLNATQWLEVPLLVVGAETVLWALARRTGKRRAGAADPVADRIRP